MKPTKILVPFGSSYADAIPNLGQIETNYVKFLARPEMFKMVLFTGGEDVHPSYYGDTSPHRVCMSYKIRDDKEKAIFDVALANNLPMAGICRGLQFLNVMAGGKLIHHLNGHSGRLHVMRTNTGDQITVNSYHHQMVLPTPTGIITGWAEPKLSNIFIGKDDEEVLYTGPEVEAAIFPEIKGFGVQYHPEMIPSSFPCFQYFYRMTKNALEMDWADFIKSYSVEAKQMEA